MTESCPSISAQKAEDRKISWVEFTPQFHSHLVKCAVALVPHPIKKVKLVMFGFILELLNGEGHMAFFELQKGGHKANNAQKEKLRLVWKRSRAAKWECEREAAKAAKLPPRQWQCEACGRKFESRKTAKKHWCPHSKVVRMKLETATGRASQAPPAARGNKPPVNPPLPAPPPPLHRDAEPSVTGDLRVPFPTPIVMRELVCGFTMLAPDQRMMDELLRAGWTVTPATTPMDVVP